MSTGDFASKFQRKDAATNPKLMANGYAAKQTADETEQDKAERLSKQRRCWRFRQKKIKNRPPMVTVRPASPERTSIHSEKDKLNNNHHQHHHRTDSLSTADLLDRGHKCLEQRLLFEAASGNIIERPLVIYCSSSSILQKKVWERCTLHGVHDIRTARSHVLKSFWILAFVLALGAAVYGCYAIINEFLKSPVVVSYFVQESDKGTIDLPDVIICPFNRFNHTFLEMNNVSRNLSDFIQLAFGFGTPYKYQRQFSFDAESFAQLSDELDFLLEARNFTFSDFVNEASLSCNAIVEYCILHHAHTDCCRTATPVMTAVGRCYRIQGISQEAAGYGLGMTIVVNLESELFTPAFNNLHNEGIAVKLAERNKGLDYDLTFIPKSVHALMPLRATRYDFIDDPPRYECLSPYNLSESYSRIDCFQECLFQQGQNYCQCAHVAAMYPKPFPACTTKQFYNCLIPQTRIFFEQNVNAVADCRSKCKAPCTYWQYTSFVSYTKFPSETIKKYIKENEWERYKNMIILDVFYEKLEYTLIKHFPRMTLVTFISNLGGQIGLWCGGSILTILQVIVYSVQTLRRSWQRRLREKLKASEHVEIDDPANHPSNHFKTFLFDDQHHESNGTSCRCKCHGVDEILVPQGFTKLSAIESQV